MVFNQDTFDTICSRVATGERLEDIYPDEGMPAAEDFSNWLMADNVVAQQFGAAVNSWSAVQIRSL